MPVTCHQLPADEGGEQTVTWRPRFRVADILREHGPAVAASRLLSIDQRKALRDAQLCRTASLGGHLDRCEDCSRERPSYSADSKAGG